MAKKPTAKTPDKPKRTLVMVSGGIDSTAALLHVLNNPETYGDIHVHHIHIQNIEGRWQAEAAAVKEILDYMRKNTQTSFTSSESTMRTPSFGNKFLFDTEVVSFITGYMTSRDPDITKVIIGATGTDFEMGSGNAVKRGKAVHNAFHPKSTDHSGKIKEYPLSKMNKKQVYNTLPPDLAALTWSCRTPTYKDGRPIECGTCKTCVLELRNIPRSAAKGKRLYK